MSATSFEFPAFESFPFEPGKFQPLGDEALPAAGIVKCLSVGANTGILVNGGKVADLPVLILQA